MTSTRLWPAATITLRRTDPLVTWGGKAACRWVGGSPTGRLHCPRLDAIRARCRLIGATKTTRRWLRFHILCAKSVHVFLV